MPPLTPTFQLPSNFAIHPEEAEAKDNDRAITVEKIKLMLHDLFEVAGFDKVGLGLDEHWKKNGSDKWKQNYVNMVRVSPCAKMDIVLRKKLNYGLAPHGDGWPAQWRIVEHYLGGNHGGEDFYRGNKNIPDFLIGVYHKKTWIKEYDRRLNAALLKAILEGNEL